MQTINISSDFSFKIFSTKETATYSDIDFLGVLDPESVKIDGVIDIHCPMFWAAAPRKHVISFAKAFADVIKTGKKTGICSTHGKGRCAVFTFLLLLEFGFDKEAALFVASQIGFDSVSQESFCNNF